MDPHPAKVKFTENKQLPAIWKRGYRFLKRKLLSARGSYRGDCAVCGCRARFLHTRSSIRESYSCPECRASLRYREQAQVIIDLLAKDNSRSIAELVNEDTFRQLTIYEPGISGPFRRYFSSLPNYRNSFYWSDIPPGEYRDGVQCQDIMNLTFEDSTFDLVITSDIFEHVRKPLAGFAELRRVLKANGVHVFSIPVFHPMPPNTHSRVDTSGPTDVFLDPPRYHGDGAGGKSLVYNDFGEDLVVKLSEIGLKTHVVSAQNSQETLQSMLTLYSVKT